MKNTFAFLFFGGLVSAFASPVPELAQKPTYSQDARTCLVTIEYSLVDASVPAIASFDVFTNGVSVGASCLTNAQGGVNCRLAPGKSSYRITWQPMATLSPLKMESGACAVVTLRAVSSPPDYMVVDLTKTVSQDDPVSYYESPLAIPGGLDDDTYRTGKLVLKRIRAPRSGRWTMGRVLEYSGASARANESYHRVGLSEDFWCGIYEMTQGQVKEIRGGKWTSNYSGDDWNVHPVELVNFTDVTNIIRQLNERSGLAFSLPGEMQWEYAARAGNGDGDWGDGSKMLLSASVTTDLNLDALAAYKDRTGGISSTVKVGSFAANSWGLFDLHGNVSELCRDWYKADISALDGAVVETDEDATNAHVHRGGAYTSVGVVCRPAYRTSIAPSGSGSRNATIGFRVVCPVANE